MSASPIARQTTNCQTIPRSVLNDASQLPSDYSSTPGGTLYSTTPGGTRIVYDRAVIMGLRNSPAARTPPKNLSGFPDLIKHSPFKTNGNIIPSPTKKDIIVEEVQEQFQMDM